MAAFTVVVAKTGLVEPRQEGLISSHSSVIFRCGRKQKSGFSRRGRGTHTHCHCHASLNLNGVNLNTSNFNTSSPLAERQVRPGVFEGVWEWRGHAVRYQRSGEAGVPVLCVHGFGANADHWRHNLPVLGKSCRAYAIDLLGYGFSAKPDPRNEPVNSIYNFDTWSNQIRDFISQAIGSPTILTSNSVGGIACLQAAKDAPALIPAVQVMNVSLRMLHTSKQAPWQRPLVAALQNTLRTTSLGRSFFKQVATREGVKSVLRQCYGNVNAVTDELVDIILKPGLEEGAVDVFLDFISYSGGPLPETLLEECPVPVSILWGEKDPWEKIEWGREFCKYPAVEEFVSLPGVGHCPQDEAPELVNPLILQWIQKHSS